MNTENKTNETTVVEDVLYYYYNNEGEKLYTGNGTFAQSRANFYETFKVYIEKNK